MPSRAGFHTPEEVLAAEGLSNEEKIEILRQWEYDEREMAVAVEEGMPGDEPSLLQRVVLALEQLTGGVDLDHDAPTKHGG